MQSSLTIDYSVSRQLSIGNGIDITTLFYAFSRVDDACKSVFTIWPVISSISAGGLAMRAIGAWTANNWHSNVLWARTCLSEQLSDDGNKFLNALQKEQQERLERYPLKVLQAGQYGLLLHPPLATTKHRSMQWRKRSEPMDETPEDILDYWARDPRQYISWKKCLADNYTTGEPINIEPCFLQSDDAEAMIVLRNSWRAELLFDGRILPFSITPGVSIGWALSFHSEPIIGNTIPKSDDPYVRLYTAGRSPYGGFPARSVPVTMVPNFKSWPLFSRFLIDGFWEHSNFIFKNAGGWSWGADKRRKFAPVKIPDHAKVNCLNIEDGWVCGIFVKEHVAIMGKRKNLKERGYLI